MPTDDSTPHVDFVAHDDLDPSGFEELPQPAGRPGLRRWRIPALVAAVLLAAAVVVLAVVARHSASTPTAAATSIPAAPSHSTVVADPATASSSPNRSAVRLQFLAGLSAADLAAARAECPRLAPTCVTTGEAPTDVLRAVRAVFGHVTQLIVLSDIAYQTTSGRSLAFRRISARSGNARVAIQVRAPQASDTARHGISYHGKRAYMYAETQIDGRTIDVEVTSPQATPADLRAVDNLAADPRLLATG